MACPGLRNPVTSTRVVDACLTGGCIIRIDLAIWQRNICLVPLNLCLYLGELYFEREHLLAGRLHFIRRTVKEL